MAAPSSSEPEPPPRAAAATLQGPGGGGGPGHAPNVLQCQGCSQPYSEPCLLDCFHTACARCLRPAVDVANRQVACPICGHVTPLRDQSSLPPKDELVAFLMRTSNLDFPKCANCDRNEKSPIFYCNTCVCWSSQRECDHLLSLISKETGIQLGEVSTLSMFFCNTCGQALCGPCREDTHRAKMFSQHDIIHISMKSQQRHQKCSMHGEQLTMFCTTTRALLCMKCFSEASLETRLHCVDVDIAYEQAKKRLERTIANVRDLQTTMREDAEVLGGTLDKFKSEMMADREAIHATYTALYDNVRKSYEGVLRVSDGEFKSKSGQLQQQLSTSTVNLPLVQVHHILSSIFASRANKLEFLTLAAYIVERMGMLLAASIPQKHPSTEDVSANFKTRFVSSLGDIIDFIKEEKSRLEKEQGQEEDKEQEEDKDAREQQQEEAAAAASAAATSAPGTRKAGSKYFRKCNQVLRVQVESMHQDLESIRGQLSRLHREISTKRCLTDMSQVTTLSRDCRELRDGLDRVKALADEQNLILEGIWEEEQRRIAADSKAFKGQLAELAAMQGDVSKIMCLSDHLARFVSSGSVGVERGGGGSGGPGGGGGTGGAGGRSRSRDGRGGKRGGNGRSSSGGRRDPGGGDGGGYSSKTLPAKRSADHTSGSGGHQLTTLPRHGGGGVAADAAPPPPLFSSFHADVHEAPPPPDKRLPRLPPHPGQQEDDLRYDDDGGCGSRLSFCSDDLPIRDSSSQVGDAGHQQLPSSVPSPIDQDRIEELLRSAKMQYMEYHHQHHHHLGPEEEELRRREEEKKELISSILGGVGGGGKDGRSVVAVRREEQPGMVGGAKQKSYEPPGIGKSSRVMPMSGHELPERLPPAASPDRGVAAAVGGDVSDLVGYSKPKFSSSTGTGDEDDGSAGDDDDEGDDKGSFCSETDTGCTGGTEEACTGTNSLYSDGGGGGDHRRVFEEEGSPFNTIRQRKHHHHHPVPPLLLASADDAESVGSAAAYHRRSSAPEVDFDPFPQSVTPTSMQSRSLDQLSHHQEGGHPHHHRLSTDDQSSEASRSPDVLRKQQHYQPHHHQQQHQQLHYQTLGRRRRPARSAREVEDAGLRPLRKTDSFEGHEEAVRTLVKAVQEVRKKEDHHHGLGASTAAKKA